ncbi:putative Integral membrane protein [Seiridium cardinale]|uniref:Integral membrane protein n=1 Tax=Seiridium cardinale TaxID=138064 RepID=A0ABR2X6U6_9PEZI
MATESDIVWREVWAEYAIGNFFILLRFYARWKVVGIRNFQYEDLFMLAAFLFWIPFISFMYMISVYGNGVGLTTETAKLLSEEEIQSRTLGAKLLFAAWMFYMIFVWCLKGALLSLYWKLAKGLSMETKIVKCTVAFTVASFFACELAHICQCLPVSRSWQINPYPGDECTARNLNYYVIGILNSLTDASIIAIPIPILFKVNLVFWRKLLLGVLLCSGVFVILATILRAYYSLQSISFLVTAMGWASREMFVAATAVCMPGIKPLISKSNWYRSSHNSGKHSTPFGGTGGSNWPGRLMSNGPPQYELSSKNTWKVDTKKSVRRTSSGGSEEFIIDKSSSPPQDSSSNGGSGGIHVTKEFTIQDNH